MTSSRYLFAKALAAIGLPFKIRRMGEAAAEMHLLREAEEFLGYFCWKKCEGIDAISTEYWSLRKLHLKRDQYSSQVAAKNDELVAAHAQRTELLKPVEDETVNPLVTQRDELLDATEELAEERDECIEEAKRVKNSYAGLKTKAEVIEEEEGSLSENLAAVKEQIKDLRLQFAALKKKRLTLASQIEANDDTIAELEDEIAAGAVNRQQAATDSFKSIGSTNKTISEARAQIGLLDTQIAERYLKVGNHLSRFADSDEKCAAATTEHRDLIRKIRCLRDSIMMNNKIVGER